MRFGTMMLVSLGLVFVMAAAGPGAEARQALLSDTASCETIDPFQASADIVPDGSYSPMRWANSYELRCRQAAEGAPVESTEGEVVGASVTHPADWTVAREQRTFDDTYGFTLWEPESGPAAHDHGGTPVLRVARAYDLEPSGIEAAVRERLAEYPDLPLEKRTVSAGAEKHQGVAVGPIPGSTPSTEVYVPVDDRVYRINVYATRPGEEGLDAGDLDLLSNLRFQTPSRPVESLGLPDGDNASTYYEGDAALVEQEESAHEAVTEAAAEEETNRTFGTASTRRIPRYSEKRISEGCYLANSRFFFQTQHGPRANKRSGDGIRTGYSIIGKPNYWGEYTHGNLKYGRCKERYYTNDKFAVDYPLGRGDAVFSPFRRGTVTFAGRNKTHEDYGIFVSIRANNGKYVNLSSHLSGLARGIKRGAKVDRNTVIGFAGDSGGPNIAVGRVHLHQAFYRNPRFNKDGAPYGGRGLQTLYHHYFRGDGGIHKLGWSHTRKQKSKGDRISH